MSLYTLDPIIDRRWDDLVASHPLASAFHQKGWLKAMAMTYGYHPIVITSTLPRERLSDGIVFCEIDSWITGKRAVSLPFSDHTDPLFGQNRTSSELAEWIRAECKHQNLRYIEVRPYLWKADSEGLFTPGDSYWLHTLSLEPSLERIFCGLHKDCVQRRIRKAERERLSYEMGNSEQILDEFYRLFTMTRKRHQLPPQPRAWFRNLAACMSTGMTVRMARHEDVPIAAILTLSFGHTVVYKYGCSDEKYHHLAGMPYLIWNMIVESKTEGIEQIDFGRSDLDDEGLIKFKDRFGTSRSRLTYLRYTPQGVDKDAHRLKMLALRRIYSVLPDVISTPVGKLLYRHVG